MTKWEYKCVPLDRKGTKEDFGFSWTYSPWEIGVGEAEKKLLPAGLAELGSQGWELAGVVPSDLWSEGTRAPNASHGVRTISCTLVFKRPTSEKTERSPAKASDAAPASPAPASPAAPPAKDPSGGPA
jgi:hypothetical protein